MAIEQTRVIVVGAYSRQTKVLDQTRKSTLEGLVPFGRRRALMCSKYHLQWVFTPQSTDGGGVLVCWPFGILSVTIL